MTETEQCMCLAEIRAIVGDPEGRLMQDELCERIRAIVADNKRLADLLGDALAHATGSYREPILEVLKARKDAK